MDYALKLLTGFANAQAS